MAIQVLQHVPFEGPGMIAQWADEHRRVIRTTHMYQNDTLPDPGAVEMVVVMGGPMSVGDEAEYPWLKTEKAWLKQVIDYRVPIIGICLGAQILAEVMGGEVYPNDEKEIGWLPIRLTAEGKAHPAFEGLAEDLTVFQWHGDTFSLPKNAKLLAESEACRNQAFVVNNHVYGFQFHLESTVQSIEQLLANCPEDITSNIAETHVQDEDAIRANYSNLNTVNDVMRRILDHVAPVAI